MIYDNKILKHEFRNYLLEKVENSLQTPVLNIIQIGDDFASSKYVSIKEKVGTKIGVKIVLLKFEENAGRDKIKQIIKESEENSHGLIFQLPVPFDLKDLVGLTPLFSDVDLLGQQSSLLWSKTFLPPTIGAIDLVLKNILSPNLNFKIQLNKDIDLSSKIVVVVGQGVLVGNPLLRYLKERNATIISLNKYTKNSKQLCLLGDIVISAAGSPKLINHDWLKADAIVIDASTSEEDGALVGDVDQDNLRNDILLSPSPGGIGAITVLYLFYNLLKLQADKLN